MRLRLVDPDAERRFTVYSKYLTQFVVAANASTASGVANHGDLVQATQSRPGTTRITRRRLDGGEQHGMSHALRLSWVMETQLVLREQHDVELLPDLLQGAASEAYYAIYHALRAFLIASQGGVGTDHAAVLKCWANAMGQRDLVPDLWRARATGRPGRSSFQVLGIPAAPAIPHSVLSTPRPNEAWDDIATALKTTRERQLDHVRGEWLRANHRRKLPGAVADAQAARFPPTTVADFFWRLRTGSHYRGAEMFLDGVSSPGLALGYHTNLRSLTTATITVLNTLTLRYVGTDAMQSAAASFLARGDVQAYEVFRGRWAALTGRAPSSVAASPYR